MAQFSISTAVTLLDYAQGPACGFSFAGAWLFSIFTLQKPRKSQGDIKNNWCVALVVSALVVISYIAQAICLIWLGPIHHELVHAFGSALVWACISVALLENAHPIWHPYVSAWILGAAFEVTLTVLQAPSASAGLTSTRITLVLMCFRILCFCILLGNCLYIQIGIEDKQEKGSDEERQSLLGNEQTSNGNGNAMPNGAINSYGAVESAESPDDSEDEDRDKDIKEAQRKRLEAEGGWFGYLKSFAIFLPHLWPRNDFWGKVCVLVMAIDMIQNRFLNILVPRQIGIITTKLTQGQSFMDVLGDILLWLVFHYLGSFAGISLLRSAATTYIENYSYTAICDLAFGHVMDLSMDFHSNKDSGEVLRSVEQANALNELFETAVDNGPVFIDLAIALWYVSHLFDVYVSFLILTLTIAYVWSGAHLTEWTRPPRRVYVKKSRNEHKTIYESISNWQTVTYFNRGRYERDRYKEAIKATISSQWVYLIRSWIGWAAQSLMMTLGWGAVVFLAVWEISTGRKPIGNLVTLIMYWDTVTYPLHTISYTYRRIVANMIDAERVLQLLQTKPTVQDTENAKELAVSSAKVEFDAVNFAYDERKEVLKNISFTADSGATVALVGETGGGKSTILKLLFRFYDVTSGSIRIDGQDLRSVTLSSLREALGVVPQDPSMFNQSIYENIRYARLDATDEEIHEACKAAAIHDKIMSFPDRYKSKVGERGVKLSGGELQRIAIARVLIKNPKIVLLDEATSAVDSSTEQLIQEAFRRLSTGRTTFVIAHRLSTIRDANLIIVIDHGEIVERGTHDELLLKEGKYFELWTKQTTGKASGAPSRAPSINEDKANDKPDDKPDGPRGDSLVVPIITMMGTSD
jgi:ABC-type transport system involved in Fe-S cluster assembly fused permease/ATPase subunit